MSELGYTLLTALGLSLAALAPSASTAANLTRGIDQDGDHYVVLDGPIIPGDAAKLANEIDAANAAGYTLDALRLNSPGGNVWEALQMAIMVRSVRNMATAVHQRSVCMSMPIGGPVRTPIATR
ncbi:MAG: hypothetical protein ACLQDM_24475 [Bradyrhizobium sp.]|jgi:hypothetical protein